MAASFPYVLIECANTHGGDLSYVNRLIDSLEPYRNGFGIKFQPLSPETLATPDFPWYEVYETLYFDPKTWKNIFQRAGQHKDLWLDLFDAYGVKILSENLSAIHGIKFQSSVLYNDELLGLLEALDLSHCELIVNIAAQEEDQIQDRIHQIMTQLKPKALSLEIGFQAYPTSLSDSGLSKIEQIKKTYGLPIVFADHLDGQSADAIYTPILAWIKGAEVIEKHVMLDATVETKYDHFSSLNPERFSLFIDTLNAYAEAINAPFINERERAYLTKTVMIPVAKRDIEAGELLALQGNLHFRRSGNAGLNYEEIKAIQNQRYILATEKRMHETLTESDFRPARIGVIVACRMKSSRLKEKALLPIGDLPSVEFCLRNALKFNGIHQIILATSTEEQDKILENHTFDARVGFYRGHPEDVMKRYMDVCDAHQLDVVVRITADMPFVDDEICSFLLEEHFKSGAEYTVGADAAVGVNLEIFNVACLKRIKAYFPNAEYSEYMTWYFQNNPDHVRIHKVDLPEIFVRPYRLTLDYEEDLILFNAIHTEMTKKGKDTYTLKEVIRWLDENQGLARSNQHLTLTYKTDASLIELLNEKTKIRA